MRLIADIGLNECYFGLRPTAVIPGPRSGTRNPVSLLERRWIPAFAGMTAMGTNLSLSQEHGAAAIILKLV
jgi:hypothetical protein